MSSIGRRIYYELSTGNVIIDTGERQGDVVATTEDQDWQLYAALQPYQQSAVGILQLNFGDYADNFAKYPCHIDATNTPPVIVWDTANPIGATLADVQKAKIAQLQNMFQQTLNGGFNSSATGTSYLYGFTDKDQTNLSQELNIINAALGTEPVAWAIKNGTVVNHTIAQFKQMCADGNRFKWAQVNQLRSLIGQVQSATTTTTVNDIQWSAATY